LLGYDDDNGDDDDNVLVLLRISKSCKWTDSDGFKKKSADPDADSDSG